MLQKLSRRASLHARVVAAATLVSVVVLWLFYFYAVRWLPSDLIQTVGHQEVSTANHIAAQINNGLAYRMDRLRQVAGILDSSTVQDPNNLFRFLEQHRELRNLFNAGFFIVNNTGEAVAETPDLGRMSLRYNNRDFFREAIDEGRMNITLFDDKTDTLAGSVILAAPIHTEGSPLGVLVGEIRLDDRGIFDSITENRYGRTGYYLLISPKDRMIITASGRERTMDSGPLPGLSEAMERFVSGAPGPFVAKSASGQAALYAVKPITATGWLVVVGLPIDEVLAPLVQMKQRIWTVALFLTVLAAVLGWWVLTHTLRPLRRTIQVLEAQPGRAEGGGGLPAQAPHEIGRIMSAFNELMETLKTRKHELEESEARYRILSQASTGGLLVHDNGRILNCNEELSSLTGYSQAELLKLSAYDLVVPEDRRVVRDHINGSKEVPYEVMGLRKNGDIYNLWMAAKNVPYQNRTVRCVEMRDVTEKLKAEEEQRIAAIAFESLAGMVITNTALRILRVNRTVERMTGATGSALTGHEVVSLFSVRYTEDEVLSLLDELVMNQSWQGEYWMRRVNGVDFLARLLATGVCDADGGATHYVWCITDITSQRFAEDEIRHLAYYDQITELPNRRLLGNRLRHACEASWQSRAYGALLYIDLDNFKLVNDAMGHSTGDELLRQVAKRLQKTVRSQDVLARIGGDEFAILLEHLSPTRSEAIRQAELVCSKVLDQLREPYVFSGQQQYHSSASIGVTLFCGSDATDEELLKQADLAMYRAKSGGRNGFRLFDPDMLAAVANRARLEAGLREALRYDQLQVHYQPQIDAEGACVGAEALLRWDCPPLGFISPSEFIPVAEEAGLVLPIGQWVLGAVCEQLNRWDADDLMRHLPVAVNISARQFQQPLFVDQVKQTLEKFGTRPDRLKLELTESVVVHDIEEVIAKMQALKDYGVGFSLDDFGTGYSSLAYLKRMPLDVLKIDKSFVHGALEEDSDAGEGRSIAQMIIQLGANLGLTVIAEGVETLEQQEALLVYGCRRYQGYLFSRPLPALAFEAFLRRRANSSPQSGATPSD